MSKTRPVVVIVPDMALNRSLAFALEAEGYRVSTFTALDAATAALPGSLCIIADQDILPGHHLAGGRLEPFAARTVMLSEFGTDDEKSDMQVLTKPLNGADVLGAVGRILHAPAALRIST